MLKETRSKMPSPTGTSDLIRGRGGGGDGDGVCMCLGMTPLIKSHPKNTYFKKLEKSQ